jgi:ABC-type Mn2+/Zn2+ transport system permease subunit
MGQYIERYQDLSTPRTSYKDILVSLSNNLNWKLGKLISKSLSGIIEEVASRKLTASADQSTGIDFKVFLVLSIISNIIVPKEFKSTEVYSLLSGKIVGSEYI